MQRIVVLNPKGGSGKTTIAINLASYLASRGHTPVLLDPRQLPDMTRDADKIIVPVLPSDIDIHACSRCIRDLLLVAKIRRDEDRIGVIANRTRRNTLTYQAIIRFLHTLGIPIVATIRDSQNYLRGAELGIGVHEMKSSVAQEDVKQWVPLVDWLARPAGRAPAPPGASSQDGRGAVW